MSNDKVVNIKWGLPGLGTLLTVLFVGLKLTDHIDWSWWWVCSPLWIPMAFILCLLVLFGIIALILK